MGDDREVVETGSGSASATMPRWSLSSRSGPWPMARCHLDGFGTPRTVIVKWLRSNPEAFRVERRQIATGVSALQLVGQVAPSLIGRTSIGTFSSPTISRRVAPSTPWWMHTNRQRHCGRGEGARSYPVERVTFSPLFR
jgi:hypothetical protein